MEMKKMRLWMGVLLAFFLSAECYAEMVGEVLEYGIYGVESEQNQVRNLSTPTGYSRHGGDVRLKYQTNQIPKQLDRLFGFRFRILGLQKNLTQLQLNLVVSHPEMIRPNGTRANGYGYPVSLGVKDGVLENQSGYRFDQPFEMVAGEWRFEYWLNGKKIIGQTFEVVENKLNSSNQP
jgi:hypothetical protein